MTTETALETIDPAAELAAFKRQVRRMAIRIAEDEGWCTEGLNEALEELGLEPYVAGSAFLGTLTLTAEVIRPRDTTELPVLTRDTVKTYVMAISGDGDVAITGQRVTAFTPDKAGGGTVQVEIDITVINTDPFDTAERWARDTLHLDYAQHYLVFDSQRTSTVTWTEAIQDPDTPGTY